MVKPSICKLFLAFVLMGLMSFIVNWGLEHPLKYIYSQKNVHQARDKDKNLVDKSLPVIYAITPTHSRDAQKADLTRLSQTFLHLTNFHWIIVEDSKVKTKLVTSFLSTCGMSNTHLNISTRSFKHRGVLQRNLALSWIREHLNPTEQPGVIYFADDDNTYDLRIFTEMRRTKRVSVWPVGLVGGIRYEKPILKNGKVTGWFANFAPKRKFAIDMAGFAVNLKLLLSKPRAAFSDKSRGGYLESDFLSRMNLTRDDLEPLADNCSKVLVWHTQTKKTNYKLNKMPYEDIEV